MAAREPMQDLREKVAPGVPVQGHTYPRRLEVQRLQERNEAEMKHTITALSATLALMLCAFYALTGCEAVPMAIYDKAAPIMDIAFDMADEAEEIEAYEEPIYYAPTYGGSVWYESDDEEAEAEAKEWIAWRESGGDYNATNGQYIGRYQLSADKLDGDYSEEHQEEVAEAYVADRYGSWQAAQDFWESHGWY